MFYITKRLSTCLNDDKPQSSCGLLRITEIALIDSLVVIYL